MRKKRFVNSTDLMTYYSSKILDIVRDIGAKPMVWQDVWDHGVKLAPEAVIQVWKDTSLLPDAQPWSYYLSKAASEGYDTILAAPFYLNMSVDTSKYSLVS